MLGHLIANGYFENDEVQALMAAAGVSSINTSIQDKIEMAKQLGLVLSLKDDTSAHNLDAITEEKTCKRSPTTDK